MEWVLHVFLPLFLGGKLLVVSWGKWQRDVRSSLICPPLSSYLQSLKNTSMRPRAEEAMQEKYFCKQVLGRRKMWPAEGTRQLGASFKRAGETEAQEGKSDGEESDWKGLGIARAMVYLLNHIKTSLKAKRKTSIQTTTIMGNLLLMIPQAVIDLSGSLKSLLHLGLICTVELNIDISHSKKIQLQLTFYTYMTTINIKIQ